jgi:zinc-ribbon family
MIIWGTRRRNKVMGQTQYTCPKCQQNSFHGIVRSRAYFTLFFVPLFPVSKVTTARCGLCGYQEKIKNETADQLFPSEKAKAVAS